MQQLWDLIWNNSSYVLAALFAISEILAQIPSVKSNSIFELIFGWLSSKEGK